MKIQFPLTFKSSLLLLRVCTGLMLAAHGSMRLYAGTVNEFGGFLNSKGFIIGNVIAWGLTFFEIIAGITLSAGYLLKLISVFFIIELLMGIILVHASNGWFVVGHQDGGIEYNVLLILVLICIGTADKLKR